MWITLRVRNSGGPGLRGITSRKKRVLLGSGSGEGRLIIVKYAQDILHFNSLLCSQSLFQVLFLMQS